MGATEEQMKLVSDAEITHVSYILILYSFAFLMYLRKSTAFVRAFYANSVSRERASPSLRGQHCITTAQSRRWCRSSQRTCPIYSGVNSSTRRRGIRTRRIDVRGGIARLAQSPSQAIRAGRVTLHAAFFLTLSLLYIRRYLNWLGLRCMTRRVVLEKANSYLVVVYYHVLNADHALNGPFFPVILRWGCDAMK